MNPTPEILLLILNYNRAGSLADCLVATAGQSYKNFTVVIANGDSQDATEEVVRRSSSILEIELAKGKEGLIHRRIAGLRVASGDILCSIADNIRPVPEW